MRPITVGEEVWESEIACCRGPEARGILWSLQDQHIGITPRLAARLAAAIAGPRAQGLPGPVWGNLFEKLIDAMDLTSAPQSFGLVAAGNRIYSVLGVAGPLIRAQCEAMGRCYLLRRNGPPSAVSAAEYAQYHDELEERLNSAIEAFAQGLQGFEAAHVLSTATREPLNVTSRTALPQVDRAAAALLRSHSAVTDPLRSVPRRAPFPSFAPRNRRSPGPQEDAVEGVMKTTREEDTGSIILSEFLNPCPVLAERLTQSGFHIYERRPRREKLRDVLVACILPWQARQLASGAFVKTCWLECMAQLGILLSNYKLFRTEFRLVEGDPFGRVRDTSFYLDNAAPAGSQLTPSDPVRRWFLAALRWLPRYIDERTPWRKIKDADARNPLSWTVAAWKSQQDRLHWSEDAESVKSSSAAGPAERFTSAHVMLILPDDGKTASDSQPQLLGKLQASLGLGTSPRRNCSITYAPASVSNGQWTFCSRGARPRHVEGELSEDSHALSNLLQQVWMDQLLREVWGG